MPPSPKSPRRPPLRSPKYLRPIARVRREPTETVASRERSDSELSWDSVASSSSCPVPGFTLLSTRIPTFSSAVAKVGIRRTYLRSIARYSPPRPPNVVKRPKTPRQAIAIKIRRSRNFDPGDTRLPYMSWGSVVTSPSCPVPPLIAYISGTIHPIGTSGRLKERPEISLSELFERLSPIFISFAQKIDRKKKIVKPVSKSRDSG